MAMTLQRGQAVLSYRKYVLYSTELFTQNRVRLPDGIGLSFSMRVTYLYTKPNHTHETLDLSVLGLSLAGGGGRVHGAGAAVRCGATTTYLRVSGVVRLTTDRARRSQKRRKGRSSARDPRHSYLGWSPGSSGNSWLNSLARNRFSFESLLISARGLMTRVGGTSVYL